MTTAVTTFLVILAVALGLGCAGLVALFVLVIWLTVMGAIKQAGERPPKPPKPPRPKRKPWWKRRPKKSTTHEPT